MRFIAYKRREKVGGENDCELLNYFFNFQFDSLIVNCWIKVLKCQVTGL